MTLKISGDIVLKNYNTPAAIAGVAPTLDYRFALDRRELDAVSLTDKLIYTGQNGTFVNQPGLIERAAINSPRFNHDPTSRLSKGLLVEASSANRSPRSEEMDQWFILPGANVTANAGFAPDGNLTADKLTTAASAFASNLIYRFETVSATSYCFSVYLKADTALTATIFINRDGGAQRSILVCNLTSSWQRFVLPWTGTQTGNIFWHITTGDATIPAGAGSIFVWGAQLEFGTTPTSYIPTASTSVTRTESASIDGTGVITGTYTMVEKPAGCAVVNGTNIDLQTGYTSERVMVFPAALSSEQITAIRSVM